MVKSESFFARIEEPDRLSLPEIQELIRDFKTLDASQIPRFRRQMQLTSLPTILRRLGGWLILNASGRLRTRLFGTVGITTISAKDAVSMHPPSIGNIVMTYGPVDEEGNVRITFVYDHRVFDGGVIADCMAAMEAELNGALVEELVQLQPQRSRRRLPPRRPVNI